MTLQMKILEEKLMKHQEKYGDFENICGDELVLKKNEELLANNEEISNLEDHVKKLLV